MTLLPFTVKRKIIKFVCLLLSHFSGKQKKQKKKGKNTMMSGPVSLWRIRLSSMKLEAKMFVRSCWWSCCRKSPLLFLQFSHVVYFCSQMSFRIKQLSNLQIIKKLERLCHQNQQFNDRESGFYSNQTGHLRCSQWRTRVISVVHDKNIIKWGRVVDDAVVVTFAHFIQKSVVS